MTLVPLFHVFLVPFLFSPLPPFLRYCQENPTTQGCVKPIADGSNTRPECDVQTGPKVGNCPVAGCMAPPTGCTMVREFARTSTGCCPKQCNFKDAAGKSCTSTTKPPIADGTMKPVCKYVWCVVCGV